jgi:hypothetical protein
MPHSFSDMAWFIRVQLPRLALANRAKAAMTRTDVAAQHERGGAIRPAFKDVRTLGLLTNRVQVQTLDQLEQVVLVRRIAQTNPQPFRFWLTGLCIQDCEFTSQSKYLASQDGKNILTSASQNQHPSRCSSGGLLDWSATVSVAAF